MMRLRNKDGIYCGTFAEFAASTHKFKEGDQLYISDAKVLCIGVGEGVLFGTLRGVALGGIKQALNVALLGSTTNLTATASTYADLAAARTSVNTLRTDAEARLDAIEAKADAFIGALNTAGQARAIAVIGVTTNLTAIPSTFADLAAARTTVNQLRTDIEARLDVIEAKFDAIIGNLNAAGQPIAVAIIGVTVNLTLVGATFADLAASRTAVNQLRGDAETRLDAIEAKNDALITALIAVNLMA